MCNTDLHTHSTASLDGSLTAKDYRGMLESGKLGCIAVTDHDRIDGAVALQKELGAQVIVGEEITTTDGELIGLYLSEAIPAGLSATETARRIHEQGGLVYVPHPFETVRKGISPRILDEIAGQVDIIEAFNGRSLQNRGAKAAKWAKEHGVAQAASSDAHGAKGWGNTYSALPAAPTRETLIMLLNSATGSHKGVGLVGRAYPKLNRLRKRR